MVVMVTLCPSRILPQGETQPLCGAGNLQRLSKLSLSSDTALVKDAHGRGVPTTSLMYSLPALRVDTE